MHSFGTAGIDYGWIVVESGNMYSGKTSQLLSHIDKIKRIEDVRQKVAQRDTKKHVKLSLGVFKHAIDKRYSVQEIASHNGLKEMATPISTVDELIYEVGKHNYRVIAIDEVQFFNEKNDQGEYKITLALKQFADDKRMVIVAGLDKDFRGMPFGPMGDILALADEKNFHASTCTVCGSTATLPQRIVNGKPAFFEDPVVLPGASESYEPRCRKCHEVPKRAHQEVAAANQ